MGQFEQAARDLVDRANAGDEVAMGTLYLVGENARKGAPFRACVVYELALRYAKECDTCGDYRELVASPLPDGAHEWLWRTAKRGDPGKRPDLFGAIKGCDAGRESVVTAFAMGPQLTDARLDGLLSSFGEDKVGAKIADIGMGDKEGAELPALLNQAGDGGDIVEACHFLGACLMAARERQCLVSGNLSVDRMVQYEFSMAPSFGGKRGHRTLNYGSARGHGR